MGSWTEKAMAVVFVLAACFLSLLYGYASYRYELFPHGVFQQAVGAYRQVTRSEDPSFYPTGLRPEDLVALAPSAQPGLTLLTLIDQDERMAIRVVDLDGSVVLDRVVDWFELWPNPEHLRRDDAHAPNDPDRALPAPTPRSRPGTHIHGIALMDDGDFVFNFEHLGLIRIDACGKPEWRLPYRTHHSVHVDDGDGTIWVSGQVNHYQVSRELPNHVPSFAEYTAFQVPPEGKILREISIPKILAANGLVGLLYLSNNANRRTDVTGDTLHLNDVETFPASAPEGFFKRGDVMVSLRNINTVLVFEAGSGKVRYLNAGMFVRQHDPDFLDGGTISVFDNNNLAPAERDPRSRTIIVRPATDGHEVYYAGDERRGFSTAILGKHQSLPNGNLLITESQRGRAFEIDRARRLVWEYVNFTGEGRVGLMEEAQRLDARFDRAFFASVTRACQDGAPAPAS